LPRVRFCFLADLRVFFLLLLRLADALTFAGLQLLPPKFPSCKKSSGFRVSNAPQAKKPPGLWLPR
jgi:hypothetical protein